MLDARAPATDWFAGTRTATLNDAVGITVVPLVDGDVTTTGLVGGLVYSVVVKTELVGELVASVVVETELVGGLV